MSNRSLPPSLAISHRLLKLPLLDFLIDDKSVYHAVSNVDFQSAVPLSKVLRDCAASDAWVLENSKGTAMREASRGRRLPIARS